MATENNTTPKPISSFLDDVLKLQFEALALLNAVEKLVVNSEDYGADEDLVDAGWLFPMLRANIIKANSLMNDYQKIILKPNVEGAAA